MKEDQTNSEEQRSIERYLIAQQMISEDSFSLCEIHIINGIGREEVFYSEKIKYKGVVQDSSKVDSLKEKYKEIEFLDVLDYWNGSHNDDYIIHVFKNIPKSIYENALLKLLYTQCKKGVIYNAEFKNRHELSDIVRDVLEYAKGVTIIISPDGFENEYFIKLSK